MLPEWSWARGTLSESVDNVVTRRRFVRSARLCAHSAREGRSRIFAWYRITVHRRGRTGDDNGAIIKMKRAGHSLAHDRPRAVERSGAQPSSSDAVLRGTKTYTHARDELYEIFFLRARQTSTGIFGTAVSFFALYHIPEIRILFWRESRYISRDIPRVSWFTANCKCKFDSGFLSRELKITATPERLLLFRDLYPLLPEFVYSIFHAAAANRKRKSRNWVLR